jgi:hypothetical protein
MVEAADSKSSSKPVGLRWPKEKKPVTTNSVVSGDSHEVDEVPAVDLSSLSSKLRPSTGGDQQCVGIPVLLEEPGHYCLLPPKGTVFILPSNRATNASAESELLRPVSELRPGSIFAPLVQDHRDLVDDFADFFLEDAAQTRRSANLWRRPFRAALRQGPLVWQSLQERLKAAGVRRHEQTFRNWAESRIIAPRDYPTVIPIIVEVSLDAELHDRSDEIVSSITKIYKARAKGAEHLLEEIFSGRFDASRMVLQSTLLGNQERIQLHVVSAIGRPITCSRTDLNHIHTDLFRSDSTKSTRVN